MLQTRLLPTYPMHGIRQSASKCLTPDFSEPSCPSTLFPARLCGWCSGEKARQKGIQHMQMSLNATTWNRTILPKRCFDELVLEREQGRSYTRTELCRRLGARALAKCIYIDTQTISISLKIAVIILYNYPWSSDAATSDVADVSPIVSALLRAKLAIRERRSDEGDAIGVPPPPPLRRRCSAASLSLNTAPTTFWPNRRRVAFSLRSHALRAHTSPGVC